MLNKELHGLEASVDKENANAVSCKHTHSRDSPFPSLCLTPASLLPPAPLMSPLRPPPTAPSFSPQDDAEKLQGLTLQWLSDKTEARERMQQVYRDLNENQQTFWKFQLRSHLLRYLADGEEKNYKKQEYAIRNSDKWNTREELNTLLAQIEINGRLSLEELKEVRGLKG